MSGRAGEIRIGEVGMEEAVLSGGALVDVLEERLAAERVLVRACVRLIHPSLIKRGVCYLFISRKLSFPRSQ